MSTVHHIKVRMRIKGVKGCSGQREKKRKGKKKGSGGKGKKGKKKRNRQQREPNIVPALSQARSILSMNEGARSVSMGKGEGKKKRGGKERIKTEKPIYIKTIKRAQKWNPAFIS